MIKDLYIDLETTGTDHMVNGITQIAGTVVINGTEAESFNFNVAPFPGQGIEEEALRVTGKTLEEVLSYPSPREIYAKFTAILNKYCNKFDKQDKFNFIAYNSPFDNQFLRSFFARNDDKYFGSYFWAPDICVMRNAMMLLRKERPKLKDFKLGTVAEYLNIDLSNVQLHDALADIQLTMLVHRAIEERMKLSAQHGPTPGLTVILMDSHLTEEGRMIPLDNIRLEHFQLQQHEISIAKQIVYFSNGRFKVLKNRVGAVGLFSDPFETLTALSTGSHLQVTD